MTVKPLPNLFSPSTSASQTNTQLSPAIPPLTSTEAIALIDKWLQAKHQIFAPPFDLDAVRALTTDPLYSFLTSTDEKTPIQWLKTNKSQYKFSQQAIQKVRKFALYPNGRATLELQIYESRELWTDGMSHPTKASSGVVLIRYNLTWVDGVWKIADYCWENHQCSW